MIGLKATYTVLRRGKMSSSVWIINLLMRATPATKVSRIRLTMISDIMFMMCTNQYVIVCLVELITGSEELT